MKLRFIVVLLAALGLAMGAAHTLELAPKMRYDSAMYAAVTSTLYGLYGAVGGVIQVAALLMSAWMCVRIRRRPGFRPALWGTLCLALSLALWAALVQPVNAEWARVMHAAPAAVPEVYHRLRDRWEYGHVAAFVAWLAGFALLLSASLKPPKAPARAARR